MECLVIKDIKFVLLPLLNFQLYLTYPSFTLHSGGKMPNSWSARVVAFCYATLSILLVILFRASMTAHVIKDEREVEIYGLEDPRFTHLSKKFKFTIHPDSSKEDYFKNSNRVKLLFHFI